MPRFTWHKRNHSFPPALKYVPTSSKILSPPLPDIDDEPWAHFLSPPDEDEEYLHFDAGILAGTEKQKQKIHKFQSHRSVDAVRHHHGSFMRPYHHGWVAYSDADPVRNDDTKSFSTSPPRRRSRRTPPGHRHSWREPSLDTLEEEIPQIIVSDYDVGKQTRERSDSVVESVSTKDEDGQKAGNVSDSDDTTTSPRLTAALPGDKPDVELNQMWFAERARL